jgi:hypothetical protein
MIGKAAAAVAMIVVFGGLLAVIGRLAGDASDGQQPVVAVFSEAELR